MLPRPVLPAGSIPLPSSMAMSATVLSMSFSPPSGSAPTTGQTPKRATCALYARCGAFPSAVVRVVAAEGRVCPQLIERCCCLWWSPRERHTAVSVLKSAVCAPSSPLQPAPRPIQHPNFYLLPPSATPKPLPGLHPRSPNLLREPSSPTSVPPPRRPITTTSSY